MSRSARRVRRPLEAGALALTVSFTAGAEPVDRYVIDHDELAWLKEHRPSAASKILEGEALLAASKSAHDVEKAAELFQAASKDAPNSSLASRRACQVLTALGRHDDAVKACEHAFLQNGKSFLNSRAVVAALVSGPDAPNSSDLARALYLAARMQESATNEPWGYAAQCDAAVKLGDTEMLDKCATNLARVAPGHYETERAELALARVRPGLGVALGWLAILAAGLGTLLHAVRRRAARKASVARTQVGVAVLTLLVIGARTARAAQAEAPAQEMRPVIAGHLSKYPIDATDPESSVPSPELRDKDPLEYGYFLMDLGDAAEKAKASGDHFGAARFYRAMVKAVPDAAVSYRKTCEEYEAAKEPDRAKKFCGAALTQRDAILDDYSHYARLVLAQPGDLDPTDVANLDRVVEHLKSQEASRTAGWDIECGLGVHLADVKRLVDCTTPWAVVAPDAPKVIFYQWVLAMHQKDYTRAERLVASAKQASAEPGQVQQMAKATFDALPIWRKAFRDWHVGATFAVVLALVLGVLVSRRQPPRVSA